MNERIKELLIKAIKEVGPDDTDKGAKEKTLEKFAELIVLECVGIVQPYMSRWPEDHQLTKEIKEHFGVKQ